MTEKKKKAEAPKPEPKHVSVPAEIAHVLAKPWEYTMGEIEKAQEHLRGLIVG